MPSPALKPCPFCGSDAATMHQMWTKEDGHDVVVYYAFCERCTASFESMFTSPKEAAAAWNRRAADAKEGGEA